MGCDIHLYLEKKNQTTGLWEAVKGRNPRIDNYREWAKSWREKGDIEHAQRLEKDASRIENGEELKKSLENLERYYPKEERVNDPDLQSEYESEYASSIDCDAHECYCNWVYDGRNYDLFAILANVRNGRGFAGVDTGDGFIPISMPKGLPNDVSEYVQIESDRWDGDGHSHSYLTLEEILDYDWNRETKHRGMVGIEEYKVYKEKGQPESWSGGIWGDRVTMITNEEMDEIAFGKQPVSLDKSYYTQVEWAEKYYESAGKFYPNSIEKLKELSNGKSEDIRIVFWFDN